MNDNLNESVIYIENENYEDEFMGASKEDVFESILHFANTSKIEIQELNDALMAELFVVKSFENVRQSELEDKIELLRNEFQKY